MRIAIPRGDLQLITTVRVHGINFPVTGARALKRDLFAIGRPAGSLVLALYTGQTSLVGTVRIHPVHFVVTIPFTLKGYVTTIR